MKAGVHVAGGSDAPVEAPTPLIGMADVTWAFFFTTKIIAADRRGGCFFFGWRVFSECLEKQATVMNSMSFIKTYEKEILMVRRFKKVS